MKPTAYLAALELVRNRDGAIVDIVHLPVNTMRRTKGGKFVQVIKGKPVAAFEQNEVLLIPATKPQLDI